MVTKNFIDKWKLDQEEIDLLKEEEKEISEKENEIFFEKAINNLKSKNKLISIRINENILNNIKQKSENIGINYQTLINILLKQYVDNKINIVL